MSIKENVNCFFQEIVDFDCKGSFFCQSISILNSWFMFCILVLGELILVFCEIIFLN